VSGYLSRRALLGLAVGGVAAGCAKAVRSAPAPTSAPTASTVPTSTAPVSNPPSSAAPTEPSTEVGHGPRNGQQVALTFHGQGDPAVATSVLAALAAGHAKVTVMAVGSWLEAYPSMAASITGGGHELGNHTWSHPDLASLSEQGIRADIGRCRDTLIGLSGSPGRYFRQSSAQHSTPLIRTVAGQLGYPVCLSYDVDSLDWTDPGPAAIRRAVAGAAAGSIVSMHFGHPGTVTALPGILDDLASRGLTPVTVSTLLHP